jgi:hypothetical protein
VTTADQQPAAWPHPIRDTDTDAAQAIADALAWHGMWLWE